MSRQINRTQSPKKSLLYCDLNLLNWYSDDWLKIDLKITRIVKTDSHHTAITVCYVAGWDKHQKDQIFKCE